ENLFLHEMLIIPELKRLKREIGNECFTGNLLSCKRFTAQNSIGVKFDQIALFKIEHLLRFTQNGCNIGGNDRAFIPKSKKERTTLTKRDELIGRMFVKHDKCIRAR